MLYTLIGEWEEYFFKKIEIRYNDETDTRKLLRLNRNEKMNIINSERDDAHTQSMKKRLKID